MKKTVYLVHYEKYKKGDLGTLEEYDILDCGLFETKELAFHEIEKLLSRDPNVRFLKKSENSILIEPDCSSCECCDHCLGVSCCFYTYKYTLKDIILNCED